MLAHVFRPCVAAAALILAACPGAPAVGSGDADTAAPSPDAIADSGLDATPADAPMDAADVIGFSGVPWPDTSCVAFNPSSSDPTAAMFDPTCVIDVDITMASTDWHTLRNETRTAIDVLAGDCMAAPPGDIFSWFVAEVKVGGVVVAGAGIRKKGFLGSLSTVKPSLKVRFDKFVPDQRLSGMKRLTLNNMQQDPGLLSACLAYDLMRAAGIAAPRCNFARVRVNDVDLGVYAHVESIKSAFLERHFAGSEGNLYEGTLSDFRDGFLGTWEKKTNEAEADWGDIDAATLALDGDDEALLAALDPVFDVDAFYTFWAMEVLVGHWDGYAGNTNNFYVYREPTAGDGRFRFIPWGVDAAFDYPPELAGEDEILPESVLAFGKLANRLYALPEGQSAYHARLLELLNTVWSEPALSAEIDRIAALLRPHLNADEQSQMAQKLGFRKAWIQARRGDILSELQPAPPTWEHGLRKTVCWPIAGDVSVTFATSWGSSGFDPLSSSGVVEADVTGIGPLGNVSCTARLGTAEDQLGEAVVEVIAQGEGDIFFLVRIIGPVGSLEPNTTYPLDWQTFRGFLGYFIPLENQFSAFGLLYGGTISFDEASPVPGALVSGSFEADVILAPL